LIAFSERGCFLPGILAFFVCPETVDAVEYIGDIMYNARRGMYRAAPPH
jgi:hypothetical protein